MYILLTEYPGDYGAKRTNIILAIDSIESVRGVEKRSDGRHRSWTIVRTKTGDEINVEESVKEISQRIEQVKS